MVIVDECHHAASETMANVLQRVKARYIYGVTATPIRGDGLEKVNHMLMGPIRYRYTSKQRAEAQGIRHLVYPRFTRTVNPYKYGEKIHPNDAYELLRNNDVRDRLIVDDVIQCISNERTPVVLTKYTEHLSYRELRPGFHCFTEPHLMIPSEMMRAAGSAFQFRSSTPWISL